MIPFAKLQGCGNDFIAVRREDLRWPVSRFAAAVCDRRFGIGADGLLLAQRSECAAVRMVYYNADGSPAALCGNGLRCFARYVYDSALVCTRCFTVETDAGVREVEIHADGSVTAEMGEPEFDAGSVPVCLGLPEVVDQEYLGRKITCLRVGVPHTVVFLPKGGFVPIEREGGLLERAEAFPEGTNVDFATCISSSLVTVKTFERGAGHTLACGSGCCAVVAAGQRLGLLAPRVTVGTEGGILTVEQTRKGSLLLTGNAAWICKGTICGELVASISAKG